MQKAVYALDGTQVIVQRDKEVQLAANAYFGGRTVYIGGLPFSAENARQLHRALLWCCGKGDMLHRWFSDNPHVDVHAYPENGWYVVCNNSYDTQKTTVYTGNGKSLSLDLAGGSLKWYEC